MATFRDASGVPEVGEEEERTLGQSMPALRKRWPFVCQLQSIPSPRTALLFLPFFLLQRTSLGRERPVSHCQHPLVINPRILLLLSVTERGAKLEEGAASVLGFTRAPRPVSETQPAARTPLGTSHALLWPLPTEDIPPKCPVHKHFSVCSRSLTLAALSLRTGVVPDPCII